MLLIDDHPVVRRGIRDALEGHASLHVVGEAADAAEAVRQIRSGQPDLAIVDISLAGESGLELLKTIRAEHPGVKLLVFSVHDEKIYAERVLRAGADGYVGKSEPAERLIEAARSVLSGHTALSSAMTERMVQQAVGRPTGEGGVSIRSPTESSRSSASSDRA